MRYLIYVRVSTDKQDEQTQISLCRELIERSHAKGEIILFNEGALSTGVQWEERPKLIDMLNCLQKDDMVVSYAIDRFARDILEQITIYREIKTCGAFITTVEDPNCDNEFIMNIKASVAQYERAKTKQRIKHNLAEKQKRMEKVGQTWYGFKTDPRFIQDKFIDSPSYGKPYKLIPDDQERKMVQLMVYWRGNGMSYKDITRRLEEEGFVGRCGKPLHKTSVFRILQREAKLNLTPLVQSEDLILV